MLIEILGSREWPEESSKETKEYAAMKRNLIYHTHINTNYPVSASHGSNSALMCQLDSLSKCGATLKCDRETLDSLLPNSLSIAPKQPTTLDISFNLSADCKINGQCKVIYARRISRDLFLLETQFDGLSETQANKIEDFVESHLRQSRSVLQAVA